MLRAISEIAVAIIVTSVRVNPKSIASWWPALRAATMSSEVLMATTVSAATVAPDHRFTQPQLLVQQRYALFEIERGAHIVEGQPQLHHGERHLWLQTDDHRGRPAQPGHVRDRAK